MPFHTETIRARPWNPSLMKRIIAGLPEMPVKHRGPDQDLRGLSQHRLRDIGMSRDVVTPPMPSCVWMMR